MVLAWVWLHMKVWRDEFIDCCKAVFRNMGQVRIIRGSSASSVFYILLHCTVLYLTELHFTQYWLLHAIALPTVLSLPILHFTQHCILQYPIYTALSFTHYCIAHGIVINSTAFYSALYLTVLNSTNRVLYFTHCCIEHSTVFYTVLNFILYSIYCIRQCWKIAYFSVWSCRIGPQFLSTFGSNFGPVVLEKVIHTLTKQCFLFTVSWQ